MAGIALKGKRMPFYSKAVSGYSGPMLEWLMDNGLTWRGVRQSEWKLRPRGWRAWLFLIFVFIPRGLWRWTFK
jgi:hypothetical protein